MFVHNKFVVQEKCLIMFRNDINSFLLSFKKHSVVCQENTFLCTHIRRLLRNSNTYVGPIFISTVPTDLKTSITKHLKQRALKVLHSFLTRCSSPYISVDFTLDFFLSKFLVKKSLHVSMLDITHQPLSNLSVSKISFH